MAAWHSDFELLGWIVDHMIRAQAFYEIDISAACRSPHFGANVFRQLDCQS
jgi:hypothetical protein